MMLTDADVLGLTPREYLHLLVDAFASPAVTFYGAATDEPEGARWVQLSATLHAAIIRQGREILARPALGIGATELADLPAARMAEAGWYRFVDGSESRERARALVLRWYTRHALHLPTAMLEDLERRLAAQLDIELLILLETYGPAPPPKPAP